MEERTGTEKEYKGWKICSGCKTAKPFEAGWFPLVDGKLADHCHICQRRIKEDNMGEDLITTVPCRGDRPIPHPPKLTQEEISAMSDEELLDRLNPQEQEIARRNIGMLFGGNEPPVREKDENDADYWIRLGEATEPVISEQRIALRQSVEAQVLAKSRPTSWLDNSNFTIPPVQPPQAPRNPIVDDLLRNPMDDPGYDPDSRI
jgi:hypothetical protein